GLTVATAVAVLAVPFVVTVTAVRVGSGAAVRLTGAEVDAATSVEAGVNDAVISPEPALISATLQLAVGWSGVGAAFVAPPVQLGIGTAAPLSSDCSNVTVPVGVTPSPVIVAVSRMF